LTWASNRRRYPRNDEFTLFGGTGEKLWCWYGFNDEAALIATGCFKNRQIAAAIERMRRKPTSGEGCRGGSSTEPQGYSPPQRTKIQKL
jgi:hypothetical protein